MGSVQQIRSALAYEILALGVPRVAQVGHALPVLDAPAEGIASGEEIDCGNGLDEFVLLRPPGELRRILRAGVHDARHAEPNRQQGATIGDVDLHAVAARPAVLVPGRIEGAGAEADAGKL